MASVFTPAFPSPFQIHPNALIHTISPVMSSSRPKTNEALDGGMGHQRPGIGEGWGEEGISSFCSCSWKEVALQASESQMLEPLQSGSRVWAASRSRSSSISQSSQGKLASIFTGLCQGFHCIFVSQETYINVWKYSGCHKWDVGAPDI